MAVPMRASSSLEHEAGQPLVRDIHEARLTRNRSPLLGLLLLLLLSEGDRRRQRERDREPNKSHL
jgi:hypothetical protein